LSDSRPPAAEGPAAADYEDLYQNAPCGYLSLYPDGRISRVNATFAKWIGFAPEELLGKRFHELLNIAGRIFYETHFAPLLRMQGFFNEVALDMTTQAGGRLPVLVNAAERRGDDGSHISTRLTIFNATDRRRYERELVEARAAAEAAKKEVEALHAKVHASLLDERETAALREQFIAVLGHDLRNPLSAIISGTTLLKRAKLDERSAQIVALMNESASRMEGLIANVMDFARGRLGGGLTLDLTRDAPVEAVLYQVIAELRASNPDRLIEAGFELEEAVDFDKARMAQLFSNLLGNALTHGTQGQPIVVRALSDSATFELSITNASPPIPPEALENLFQPFFRGAVRPTEQGLGLGLYIASEIARAHGGRIDVQSGAEETTFTFRMPTQLKAGDQDGAVGERKS
jgi:sigma-B regulation protein RsbU (phosphoserine phosphatase)